MRHSVDKDHFRYRLVNFICNMTDFARLEKFFYNINIYEI